MNWYNGDHLNQDGGDASNPRYLTGSWSWVIMAMPYMDQAPLYNQISTYFGVASGNPPNCGMGYTTSIGGIPAPRDLAKKALPALTCPSSEHLTIRRGQIIEPDGGGWNAPYSAEAGGLDYVGNMGHIWGGWKDCDVVPDFPSADGRFVRGSAGTPWVSERWNNDVPNINGVFLYRGSMGIRQIVDGTSNTVLLFESQNWRGGNGAIFRYDHLDTANWASALAAVAPMRNPINLRNPAWQNGEGDIRCGSGPSSLHVGGVQVTLCDGSVRFLSENIDHSTRYNLANRRDRNPIGEF